MTPDQLKKDLADIARIADEDAGSASELLVDYFFPNNDLSPEELVTVTQAAIHDIIPAILKTDATFVPIILYPILNANTKNPEQIDLITKAMLNAINSDLVQMDSRSVLNIFSHLLNTHEEDPVQRANIHKVMHLFIPDMIDYLNQDERFHLGQIIGVDLKEKGALCAHFAVSIVQPDTDDESVWFTPLKGGPCASVFYDRHGFSHIDMTEASIITCMFEGAITPKQATEQIKTTTGRDYVVLDESPKPPMV